MVVELGFVVVNVIKNSLTLLSLLLSPSGCTIVKLSFLLLQFSSVHTEVKSVNLTFNPSALTLFFINL